MDDRVASGLDAAVAAGVIDRAMADRLAPYLVRGGEPAAETGPDDEKLRLVTGFNDIFVTIGLGLFLGALAYLASEAGFTAACISVAVASWGLAEFFTRMRRMALPSIVLLLAFVGAVFAGVLGARDPFWSPDGHSMQMVLAGLAGAAAALAHWLRFHVPITVAAGTAALVAILLALVDGVAPELFRAQALVFLPIGLAVFGLAMWFDSSDLTRQTRRTDIAFWLHLLAAPIIVHPILMGLTASGSGAAAGQVIATFLVLAGVALVIDRRAILVSALGYLAYAAGALIAAAGIGAPSYALSALAVGAVVLLLSAAWRPMRRIIVGLLPRSIQQQLPAVS